MLVFICFCSFINYLHCAYSVHLYSLYRLKTFHRIPINRPIRCVAFAYMNRKFTHILVGCEETDPNQPSLMIVLGRNVEPRLQMRLPFGGRWSPNIHNRWIFKFSIAHNLWLKIVRTLVCVWVWVLNCNTSPQTVCWLNNGQDV